MSGMRSNKDSQVVSLQKAGGGLQKHFANKTLRLANKVWKEADLLQLFQAQESAVAAADAARQAWLEATAKQNAGSAEVAAVLSALRQYVAAMYGTSSSVYTDFGFAAQRRAKPTVQTKSAAVQQGRATRKARNTMGKKQKLAIRGVATPPASEPGAPIPSSAPASSVTPASTGSPVVTPGASR
jgi:hypothetical protein